MFLLKNCVWMGTSLKKKKRMNKKKKNEKYQNKKTKTNQKKEVSHK